MQTANEEQDRHSFYESMYDQIEALQQKYDVRQMLRLYTKIGQVDADCQDPRTGTLLAKLEAVQCQNCMEKRVN